MKRLLGSLILITNYEGLHNNLKLHMTWENHLRLATPHSKICPWLLQFRMDEKTLRTFSQQRNSMPGLPNADGRNHNLAPKENLPINLDNITSFEIFEISQTDCPYNCTMFSLTPVMSALDQQRHRPPSAGLALMLPPGPPPVRLVT